MNKHSRLQREAKFLCHRACPDCGSSDALAVYSDHTHCFACGKHENTKTTRPKDIQTMTPRLSDLDMDPWTAPFRGLDDQVLSKYGIIQTPDGVAFNYRGKNGQVIARKYRSSDKKIKWEGVAKEVVGFGQHLANPVSHSIAICEGEIDAPSIFQASNGKTIGVSVPNGAQNAANFIKQNLDWFQQFPVIYIATDMDDPGEAAAKAIAELFTSGQARRVVFPLKDANEVLTEMGGMALRDALTAAQAIRPDGIKSASTFQGLALKPQVRTATDCAFSWWNQKTRLYDNQLVVLVAGSGVGKTTFARALALGLMENNKRVGWIGLEETVDEAIFRFVGMAAGVQLHARDSYSGMTDEQTERVRQADKFVTGSGNLELFDHFGSLDEQIVLQRMNYMVRALGCEFLFLDHLTILGSGMAQDTRHLDAMVTKIRSFVAATRCTVIAINHLNRGSSQTTNMENGGVPELHDIRGSHSIVQLADTVWALGRKRGEPITHSYCLKNRMLGRCGYAGSFVFDEDSQQFEQKYMEPDGLWN